MFIVGSVLHKKVRANVRTLKKSIIAIRALHIHELNKSFVI